MPAAEVGSRVQILRARASVRYVGSVVNQEGTWVGVEWDDASRGKHDGSTGESKGGLHYHVLCSFE